MYQLKRLEKKDWNLSRIEELLLKLNNKKVLAVGDVGVDRYVFGEANRISPEAPVPVVKVIDHKLKLGLTANVAENICALGGTPFLLGVIGTDTAGRDFLDLLRHFEITSDSIIEDHSKKTVLKERVLSNMQQLLRVDYEDIHEIDAAVEDKIISCFKKTVTDVDVVILEDYSKGMLTNRLMKTIFDLASQSQKKVLVDPSAVTKCELYSGAYLLAPNHLEAKNLSGIDIKNDEDLARAAEIIFDKTGCENLLITLGKEGMAAFTKGVSKSLLIPTFAQDVYDVSGAGDTVIAVCALAIAAGATLEESAILGNLASGVEVSKRGTATVSVDEIRNQLIKTASFC